MAGDPTDRERRVQAYDHAPIPGTYWMHSHEGLQEQSLMTAPLIVHDVAELREDRQEVILMLHDFTFRTPEEVLASLTGTSVAAERALVQKSDESPGGKGGSKAPGSPMLGMAAHAPDTGMSGMGISEMVTSGSGGMQMDLNDVDYDAFLASDRTLSDPEIVRVERGGRIRLRIINGASATLFWIDLGALTGTVIAVDGFPVRPVQATRLPLAIAQRLDVLIDLPGNGPIRSSLRSRASEPGPGSSSRRRARLCRASPRTQKKLCRRSICRLNSASKRRPR